MESETKRDMERERHEQTERHTGIQSEMHRQGSECMTAHAGITAVLAITAIFRPHRKEVLLNRTVDTQRSWK